MTEQDAWALRIKEAENDFSFKHEQAEKARLYWLQLKAEAGEASAPYRLGQRVTVDNSSWNRKDYFNTFELTKISWEGSYYSYEGKRVTKTGTLETRTRWINESRIRGLAQ